MTKKSLTAAALVATVALSPVTAVADDISSDVAISSDQLKICNAAGDEVAWNKSLLDDAQHLLEEAKASEDSTESDIEELEKNVDNWKRDLAEAQEAERAVAESCKKGAVGRIATVFLTIAGILAGLGLAGYGVYTSGVLKNLGF